MLLLVVRLLWRWLSWGDQRRILSIWNV